MGFVDTGAGASLRVSLFLEALNATPPIVRSLLAKDDG